MVDLHFGPDLLQGASCSATHLWTTRQCGASLAKQPQTQLQRFMASPCTHVHDSTLSETLHHDVCVQKKTKDPISTLKLLCKDKKNPAISFVLALNQSRKSDKRQAHHPDCDIISTFPWGLPLTNDIQSNLIQFHLYSTTCHRWVITGSLLVDRV